MTSVTSQWSISSGALKNMDAQTKEEKNTRPLCAWNLLGRLYSDTERKVRRHWLVWDLICLDSVSYKGETTRIRLINVLPSALAWSSYVFPLYRALCESSTHTHAQAHEGSSMWPIGNLSLFLHTDCNNVGQVCNPHEHPITGWYMFRFIRGRLVFKIPTHLQ